MTKFLLPAAFALCSISILFALALPVRANVNVGRYDAIHIVPAPGKVAIDGDLSDWDKSGGIYSYRFEEQKDIYAFNGYMMYDTRNLYIGAHIVDHSPMMNMCNPDSEGAVAYNGDCLQVRISTDKSLGWPVKDAQSKSDQIAHITMWYYTPKSMPCLNIAYGMDYHGLVIDPAGWKGAYVKDPDGKGYTLEYAIPWTLLHCDQNSPHGGDTLACIWQLIWGDATGMHWGADLSEIRNPNDNSLAYQSASDWGKAIYETAGHLPPGSVVALDTNKAVIPNTGFLPITYTIPGKLPQHVSMHIVDGKGATVRWMLGDAPRQPGRNTELWNGLDNDGNPVAAGKYTVQWCSYNVKGKLLATADNPGNPPYNTSDNSGSWAGDYGWPTAITADSTNVFIGHLAGEASRVMIKVTPRGQRVWGIDPMAELGPHIIDMCNDGAYLYALAGDFKGNPCKTGGFMKLKLDTGFGEPIGNLHRSYVNLTSPDTNGGAGTTKNMSGIAVNSDTVFVSSEQAGQIFCIDKAAGTQRSVIDKIDKPRGIAIGADDRLYVVADATVVSMKVDGTDRKLLVDNLMEPQRIAVAANGEFYVSVRGFYQQVNHYSPGGKLINAIGQRGGMLVPGPWVKEAMLRPLGVAIAPDGNIWVTEERMNPKRTSVWKPDGTFVREFDGPVPYSSACTMDPDDPAHIYSENTQFHIDYATGKTWPTAVIYDDGDDGQAGPVSGGGHLRMIHYAGRTFFATSGGSIYELIRRQAYLRVSMAMTHYGPKDGWDGEYMGMGIDRNQDGKIEPAESQLAAVTGGNNWYAWVADNMDIYIGDSVCIWRTPFEGFDANGVPIYNMAHAKMLLARSADYLAKYPGAVAIPGPGGITTFMVDSEGNIYLAMSTGGSRIKRGESLLPGGHSIIKLSPDLKVLWTYRNVVSDMGSSWATSMSKPGEIEGICNFTGEMGRYITIGSYYGQYHVIDKETGLYITSITPDTRTEPPMDGMAVFAENFNGDGLYAKSLKKYLYCGGDADARVWEVQGLDQVNYESATLTVSSADSARALANRNVESGVAPKAKLLPALEMPAAAPTADLAKWSASEWAPFAVDDKRKGRAAVAWDTNNQLDVIFDVDDASPLLNRGGNPNLIFKTGDCVEIDLSAADPDAVRTGGIPILGDKRLLVAVVQDGRGGEAPLVMLYEPVSNRKDATPGTFHSPVSTHVFGNVAPLSAPVAFKRRPGGYTIEVLLNASQLGIGDLAPGRRLRADFGALFSDQGGVRVIAKTLWSDDSPELSVVEDVPTESNIRPEKWGWVVLR